MGDVSDQPDDQPQRVVPSPQMFARPAAPAGRQPTTGAVSGREDQTSEPHDATDAPAGSVGEDAAIESTARSASAAEVSPEQSVTLDEGSSGDEPTADEASVAVDAPDGAAIRYPSTGDARVDEALAGLPDPKVHEREEASSQRSTADHTADIAEGDASESAIGGVLPDPELLDSQLADVTSVHRQLQQRLSDLSG